MEIEGPFPQRLWPCEGRRPESDPAGVSLIKYRGIPEYCVYTKTRWDLIMSTIIARATHTLAATLALFRRNRSGRWSERVCVALDSLNVEL